MSHQVENINKELKLFLKEPTGNSRDAKYIWNENSLDVFERRNRDVEYTTEIMQPK